MIITSSFIGVIENYVKMGLNPDKKIVPLETVLVINVFEVEV